MQRLIIILAACALVAQTPTGVVTLYDGAAQIGTGSLVNGVATFSISNLGPGTHSVKAVYAGDPIFAGSNATLAQTVSASGPIPEFMIPATATAGQAFQYAISASNAPTAYSSTELPPGLTINQSTGLVSGTPTTAGTFNATLNATNANGTGSIILSLTVNPGAAPPPPGVSITSLLPSSPMLGQTVSLSGSGFSTSGLNYIWITPSGGLTFGLTASTANSTILSFSINASFKRGTYSLYVQNSANGNSNAVSMTVQ